MASKNNDVGAEVRMAALFLSALVKATDDELPAMVDKRSLPIDAAELMRVRDLLRAIGTLVQDADDDRWPHLLAAHRAIVGGAEEEVEEPAPPDDNAADEPRKPSLSDGDIEPPPSLADLLGKSEPPMSISGTYPPSPWAQPTRAIEARTRAAGPLIPPVAVAPPPPRPVAPSHITTTGTERPPAFGDDDASIDDDLDEDGEPRRKTLPPVPMGDGALPFASAAPHPETPNAKSLPPPALAAVIAGLPPMTLVSYAALCASSQALPQRVAETHAKFGVTGDEVRQSLDAQWQHKLNEDERLRELWVALTDQFRSWLLLLR